MNATDPVLLVLDDDDSIRLSLSALFEDRGWKVLSCTNGEEALEQLHQCMVHAAVVDIRMKGMTGDMFIRQAMSVMPDLIFLVFTGSLDYRLPPDLLTCPTVNKRVFHKPLLKIDEMEAALKLLLETTQTS